MSKVMGQCFALMINFTRNDEGGIIQMAAVEPWNENNSLNMISAIAIKRATPVRQTVGQLLRLSPFSP